MLPPQTAFEIRGYARSNDYFTGRSVREMVGSEESNAGGNLAARVATIEQRYKELSQTCQANKPGSDISLKQ